MQGFGNNGFVNVCLNSHFPSRSAFYAAEMLPYLFEINPDLKKMITIAQNSEPNIDSEHYLSIHFSFSLFLFFENQFCDFSQSVLH